MINKEQLPPKRVLRLSLPLWVYAGRSKKWILNLNRYRNAHHRELNDRKIDYSEEVLQALRQSDWDGVPFTNAQIELQYWHPNKGRVDKSNPCSVIEKFACDALTYSGVWADDDSLTLPVTVYRYMGVDKNNPRCDVIITEL